MTPEQALEVVREVQRRAELKRPVFLRAVHDAQQRLLDDVSQFKAALCSRRAGKTTVALRAIAATAMRYAGSRCAYMGLTLPTAQRLAWKPLRDLAKKHKLGWKFNKIERTIYLPNGSEIFILAGDRRDDIDKIRGFAFHRFVIDECASYGPHFRTLIAEVIEPALSDHRGDLWLIGTPGPVSKGYFYDATTGAKGFKKWSVHRWTVRENPYFIEERAKALADKGLPPQTADEYLEEVRTQNEWDRTEPAYIREYEGGWCSDTSVLVYKFGERNCVDKLPFPISECSLVLGLDFGVVDGFAQVVLAYHPSSPTTYVIRADVQSGLAPSQGAAKIRILQRELYEQIHGRPAETPDELDSVFDDIVADTQGQGLAWTKEFSLRHGIFCTPAQKTEKRAFIDHINSDFVSGNLLLLLRETGPLQDELTTLPWKNEDRMVEHPRSPNHLCDALLYAWRFSRAWDMPPPEEEQPDPGTPEWYERKARLEEERAAEEAERQARMDAAGAEGDVDLWTEYDSDDVALW